MQVPLDITFQNSEPSEAIRSEVEKQAKRLEKFHDRITSCHVTVIAPTMKRRHGDLFKIDICLAMPNHKEILVSKAHGDAPEHEHVMVAIKDAFAAAQLARLAILEKDERALAIGAAALQTFQRGCSDPAIVAADVAGIRAGGTSRGPGPVDKSRELGINGVEARARAFRAARG